MNHLGNPGRKAAALADLTDKQQVGLDIYLTQVQPELDVSNHVLSFYGPTGHTNTILECPSCLVTEGHTEMCTCLYWHKLKWNKQLISREEAEIASQHWRSEDR